ncbi:hypothetical protein [Streptomyces olivaceiscleroticus]|uniref:Serine/threonine protein kinase n=1 Tax=Streptomyces olivaceiscleroticus TaxID=68245 RepID=A0ABN0ZM87_9ACTN
MTQVRGHYRRDGSYVRPHYRRPRARSAGATYSRPARIGAAVPRSRPAPAGPTTRVRGHYRSNGSYVRPHQRRISPAAAAAGGGGGLLLLWLLLAVLGSGPSGAADTPHTPGPSITSSPGPSAR